MPYKEVTEDTKREWEEFCRSAYAEYKKKTPPPFIAFFWSASAYYDSYTEWFEGYIKHMQKIGDQFLEEYGLCVVNWNVPVHEPIDTRPISERHISQ